MELTGNLLVVDDSYMNRDLLARRLIHQGHTVKMAEDGVEALDMMRVEKFDIVLLDIMMPNMNGFQVLEHRRKDPDLLDIPVIVISAMDDTASAARCIELGAEDYLQKPFNKLILKARIQAVLERSRWRVQERERIIELTVMQQIDHELNTTLKLKSVFEIALKRSLQLVGAQAGVAGLVEEGHARIIVNQGYDGATLPEILPHTVEKAIESGRPLLTDLRTARRGTGYLSLAKSQVVVPIRREQKVAGIMMLESTQPDYFTDDHLMFLKRLSNHAAIAILNAQLYAAVEAANRAKSDFISLVAHELKVPMTSIKGYASMLSSGVMGEVNNQQGHALKIIDSNVDRMSTLVSDLADISRIESGQFRLDVREYELAEMVKEVVRSANSQTEAKHQVLMMNVPANLPPVQADRVRLLQVLTNLVSNASKYTPEYGVITVDAEIVEQGLIQVAVQDTGMGISVEDQAGIFKKFFRTDDVMSSDIPGTGLGLNITKTLVELQGGEIWFESEVGEGTTFYFTIPTLPSPDTMAA